MFDLTPDPVAFQIGPIPILWYGLAYAVGLAAVYLVVTRLARVTGRDPELVGNGILVIAVAALAGGRLYHVIDQWERYAADPLSIVLPPYSGLGVYGGIVTGTLAAWLYLRWLREPFWTWADIVAPGLFVMQAIGRWGNFFNQELYGPPTTLPWGIPIECAHRIPAYPCDAFPFDTTRFHPLFLYESLSGVLGAIVLSFLLVRYRHRFAPGSLLFLFFIWYGVVRFALETLRENNWIAFGVPTAQIVSVAFILVGFVGLLVRNSGPAGRRRDEEAGSDAQDDDADTADAEATGTGVVADEPEAGAPDHRPAGG
jgi:phosphatidylglycerol:prolipoprotein diacylglycerol transferase